MKKNNLFKVIALTIVVAMVLTMLIPGTTADYLGNVTVADKAEPVGIWTLLSNFNIALSYFSTTAIYILAIAVFYSVLGKTESYNSFVEKTVSAFKGKELILTTVSIVIFGILAAVIGNPLVLLVFVPFMYTIMSKINIDRKAILASTIIAALLGAMCGIYDSTLFSIFSIKISSVLIFRIVLLVLTLFVLTIFVAPTKSDKKEKVKESSKKPAVKKAASKSTTTKKASAKKASTKGRKKVTK